MNVNNEWEFVLKPWSLAPGSVDADANLLFQSTIYQ